VVSSLTHLDSTQLEADVSEYPNWFATGAQSNFATYLIQDTGLPNLKYLQLGAFTGDASVWLLENILTGQGSRLTDVDTWKGSDEIAHKSMDFDDVFATYKKKIAHKHNITIVQRSTTNFLVDEWANKSQYDFIYIDADHTTVGVLMDAELSWPLLKSGGIMAFDDLTWGADLPPSQSPKAGILLFAERHRDEFDLIVANTQYWIKKK
jgi:predicted O-methyltransferase YrrM